MKFKIYLYQIIAVGVLLFGAQSCFQDLGQDPPFNFPQMPPPPEYSPLKLSMPFEGDLRDVSNYDLLTAGAGAFTFVDGINGKGYKGAADAYVLVTPTKAPYPGGVSPADTITNLGSFTIAFWMNSEVNSGATGLFGISNTKEFWGNLDIFLDNAPNNTDAFLKVHLFNNRTSVRAENWIEITIPNTFKRWSHLVFRYDGTTSVFNIFKDGVSILTRDLKAADGTTPLGALKFNDAGPIVLGTVQFQTVPSLTSGATAQDWAKSYLGALDQLHFYNKAISNADIQSLFTTKE